MGGGRTGSGSIDFVDVVLVAVGLFYAAGACLVTRAALMSMFLDRAIAGIEGKSQSRAETAMPLWHVGSSALLLAGGLALALRLDAATWLFVVSAATQALYLTVLAPRYFDAIEPPDAEGRRQTTNAFLLYTAATAFVLWAHYTGRLRGWDAVGVYWLILAGGALAAYAAWVLRQFAFKLASGTAVGATQQPATLVSDNDSEPFDPAKVRRLRVMADHGCHPLWSMDEGLPSNIPPDALGLSAALTADLDSWAAEFDASLDPDDPSESRWSAGQHKAHAAQGHILAQRLAAERPDLEVHVWDAEQSRLVAVHPREEGGAQP